MAQPLLLHLSPMASPIPGRSQRRPAQSLRRLLVFLLAPALLGACYDQPIGGPGGGPGDSDVIPSVEAVQARVGALPLVERLNGVVKAENQVAIHAEISAPVAEVLVRSGAAVRQGQPLVRLQDDTLRDQLRQTEASFRLAVAEAAEAKARVAELQAQVKRSRVLADEALISDLDLETQEARLAAIEAGAAQAEARVEAAQAEVEERQTALRRTLIRAPVSGRIGRRNVEAGMLVDSGNVLFVIGSLDELRVEIPLTEAMLAYVDEGQSVRIASPALSEPIEATISRISPFLSESSFSTTGEIDIRNRLDKIRPGMFVNVDILYGETESATLVPSSALWADPRSGTRGAYVVSGELPASASAHTPEGGTQGAEVEVSFRPLEVVAEGRAAIGVAGLTPGEWTVTVGQHLLRSDAKSVARVHPTDWDDVTELQALQREDLVRSFIRKQQEVARIHGAKPPSNEDARREALERGAAQETESAAGATAAGATAGAP